MQGCYSQDTAKNTDKSWNFLTEYPSHHALFWDEHEWQWCKTINFCLYLNSQLITEAFSYSYSFLVTTIKNNYIYLIT